MSSRIHASAIIDPAAHLAPDVVVGPFAIVEGPVILSDGCVVQAHAQLIGPITAGANNNFGRSCIVGTPPQHLAADGNGADIIIGTGNIFREHVTIHRGASAGKVTRVGDNNFLMAGAHVAHDCTVGNRCIFANNALLAGHVTVEDNVFLSGNTAVHQFVRVGRLALLSGVSAATQDVVPFTVQQSFNQVVGVNIIGMRRAGITAGDINAVRRAFRMLYLHDDLIPIALEKVQREFPDSPAVEEMLAFIRNSRRGITTNMGRVDRRAA